MRLAIVILLAVALTLAAFLGYKLYERNQIASEYRDNSQHLITNLRLFPESHQRAIEILSQAHPAAFDKAYDFGSVLDKATSDEQIYTTELVKGAWLKVRDTPNPDTTKALIYMVVRSRSVEIDGQILPRIPELDQLIYPARGQDQSADDAGNSTETDADESERKDPS